MSALPGWAIDLAADGVDLRDGRKAVVMAVRRIMLAAHSSGWRWQDIHALLTDPNPRYTLPKQIRGGQYGGRSVSLQKRDRFLREHWESTAQAHAKGRPWSRDEVLGAIEAVSDAFDADTTLTGSRRQVFAAVLEKSRQLGTLRPAVSSYQVEDMTGIPKSTADRILKSLCAEDVWLRLVQRGNAQRRRANLYALAPAIAQEHMGAYAPVSHPLDVSHLDVSHPAHTTGAPAMGTAALMLTLTPEEQIATMAFLAERRAREAQTTTTTPPPAGVTDLTARRAAGGRPA